MASAVTHYFNLNARVAPVAPVLALSAAGPVAPLASAAAPALGIQLPAAAAEDLAPLDINEPAPALATPGPAARSPRRTVIVAPDVSVLREASRAALPAAEPGVRSPAVQPHPKRIPVWEQTLMYLGVVGGVVLSSAVQQFVPGGPVGIQLTWGSVALGAVVGLVIIPQVFEKLKVDPDSPFIVRLGLFVQNGVFWQVTFSAIGKLT